MTRTTGCFSPSVGGRRTPTARADGASRAADNSRDSDCRGCDAADARAVTVETSQETRVYDTTAQYTPIVMNTHESVVRISGPSLEASVLFDPTVSDRG